MNLSYYGMKHVLVLFLAEQITKGELGLSSAEASSVLASFMMWVTIFFWMAYNHASMSIALNTQNSVNLSIGNFQIPTS